MLFESFSMNLGESKANDWVSYDECFTGSNYSIAFY